MNFKEATDSLFERVDHEGLARALGISIASIRQARLRAEASAHRSPPESCRGAVIALAEARAKKLVDLAQRLRVDE